MKKVFKLFLEKVKDIPLSLEPQSLVFFSGSDHNKSHKRP